MDNGGIEPIRRLKVADSVAERLEELISGGRYATGQRLPSERVLAEQFGVGRSSMREALRMVESAGLVRTDHGVGIFVVRTSRNVGDPSSLVLLDDVTVRDLFEVRVSLERDAAAHASRRRLDDHLGKLDALLSVMRRRSVTNDEFVRWDADLHQAIAEATRNPLYLRLMETLRPMFISYSTAVIGLPGRRMRAQEGHEEIVDAIRTRRARDAGAAAVRHIRAVEDDIVEHMGPSV